MIDSVQVGWGRKASWAGRRAVLGTSGKWVKKLGLRILPSLTAEGDEELGRRLRRADCSGAVVDGAVAVADEIVVEDAWDAASAAAACGV